MLDIIYMGIENNNTENCIFSKQSSHLFWVFQLGVCNFKLCIFGKIFESKIHFHNEDSICMLQKYLQQLSFSKVVDRIENKQLIYPQKYLRISYKYIISQYSDFFKRQYNLQKIGFDFFYLNLESIFNLLLILYFQMLRKRSQNRAQSPFRSPLQSQTRPLSPIRSSPFSRQAPMSPIRARRLDQAKYTKVSTTPSKIIDRNDQFYRKKHSNTNYKGSSNTEVNPMQMTIKKGQGLFQQLASGNRICSDRKDMNMNRISSQINPFQYGESVNKNSNKINNVQNIGSKLQMSGNYSKQYGKIQNTIKTVDKVGQTYNMLQSFSIQKQSQIVQNIQKIPDSKQHEQQAQQLKKQKQLQYQHEWNQLNVRVSMNNAGIQEKCKQNQQKNDNPEVINSFEHILFLLKKAGQKNKQNTLQTIEDNVKNSITKSKISFNMNAFLQ